MQQVPVLLLNPGGSNPQDAAILQFDFTVATDSVRFRYVWASEEYHDYVGTTCNDVFGFLLMVRELQVKKYSTHTGY
ncbi:MAG: choice-of-anchor L domain-containing protein [Bacteroidetes bacterium]|nr:choice-of-anchor L domain-containing protein [Bacteroidota bacterium]